MLIIHKNFYGVHSLFWDAIIIPSKESKIWERLSRHEGFKTFEKKVVVNSEIFPDSEEMEAYRRGIISDDELADNFYHQLFAGAKAKAFREVLEEYSQGKNDAVILSCDEDYPLTVHGAFVKAKTESKR